MKLKIIILIISCLFPFLLFSQYYTSGEDPASLRWNSIKTENFNIIFPERYTEKAQYLAKIFETIYQHVGNSLEHKFNKISVLIHPETTYSNGFVSWAPKRIELFPTPNQKIYPQEWLQQLALHESRHVVQIDRLNKGFVKMLSYIFGEQAVGGVLGLYMPMWFLEGDAVVTETALSQTGRGRSPWFEQQIRAQVMDKEIYSYDKAYFGSYKDFTPNYYEMGYQLVAGARAKYGLNIWSDKFYDLISNTSVILPFLSKKKKQNYISKDRLYNEVFSHLNKSWYKQDCLSQKTPINIITKGNDEYINFKYPVLKEDGSIIAEISGPGEIDRFVQIDSEGNYKIIVTPGKRNEEPFSYNKNILCWTEYVSDKRWENRGWSIIKCFDLKNLKQSVITKKSRYFSPSISSDGNLIVAVNASVKNDYSLSIINRKTGREIKSISYDENSFYVTPIWSPNNDKIACVLLSDKGKRIVVYNLITENWTDVTNVTYDNISLPKWKDDHTILFTAGFSGIEEIYSVKTETKSIKQLTQSKFGSTGAVFDSENERFYYSTYTSDGYKIGQVSLEDVINRPLKYVKNNSNKLYEKISSQEKQIIDFSVIDTVSDYEVTKYSKFKHLFNFHSWAPANIDVNEESVSSGLSVLSQNILGTAITSLGYNFDSQKSLEKYHLNFQYRGWYPVIELDVKYGDDRVEDGYYTSGIDTIYVYENPKQKQTKIEFGINLPLKLTHNKYHRYFQPSLNYNFYKLTGYNTMAIPVSYQDDNFVQVGNSGYFGVSDITYSTLEYSLYYHNLLMKSERDVNYRWGQVFEVSFQSTPFDGINIGKVLGARSRFYCPGLFKYHSIKIDNEFQYKWKGEEYSYSSQNIYRNYYRFGNYYNFARGYYNYTNDQLYSLKTNYMFPLWNPDLSLPGLFYLKRITTNVFFDYSQSSLNYYSVETGNKTTFSNTYKSVGTEILGEAHIFRFLYPVSIGYRFSRLLSFHSNYHEFLIGINISGFSVGSKK